MGAVEVQLLAFLTSTLAIFTPLLLYTPDKKPPKPTEQKATWIPHSLVWTLRRIKETIFTFP